MAPTPATIRGLLSRSRQDVSKIDQETTKRQPFSNDCSSESDTSSKYSFKKRPKSEFFVSSDFESPLTKRKDLVRSLENLSQSGASLQNAPDVEINALPSLAQDSEGLITFSFLLTKDT